MIAKTPFEETYRELRMDFLKFLEPLNFRSQLTGQQKAVSVPIGNTVKFEDQFLAITKGQGCGFTRLMAAAGLWRAWRSPDAQTVVTATSWTQLQEMFLKEARDLISGSDDWLRKMFECKQDRIEICGNRYWGLYAVSPKDEDHLRGWHNDHLTFIIDEATGVDRVKISRILGTMSNRDRFVALLSNPNKRDSYLHDATTKLVDRPWKCFEMSAEDSPLTDKEWIAQQEEMFGRDSNTFRIQVLGKWPTTDPQSLFNDEDLEACAQNDAEKFSRIGDARQFGIDLARFGDDKSVVMPRKGMAILDPHVFKRVQTEPSHVLRDAMRLQAKLHWKDEDCIYCVDRGGEPGGAIHVLYDDDEDRDLNVFEFAFGGNAHHRQRYGNAATEAWFELRSLVQKHACHIPRDPVLWKQLTSRTYDHDLKTRAVIQPKEVYRRETGGSSPDEADALVLAFYPYAETDVQVG